MTILSVAELRQLFDPDRVEQLASDFTGQFGDIVYDVKIVEQILGQAEGLVKNALRQQYTVVQLEADAGIKRLIADLTMFYLELRRPPVPPATLQLREDALKFLDQLQKGKSNLGDVQQLLPIGSTEEPTEATDSGYFD